jgi:hypothetical protein
VLALALGASGIAHAKAAAVPKFSSCKKLNARYPHGVGRVGARDKTTGTPVTTFVRNNKLYEANKGRDRDKGQGRLREGLSRPVDDLTVPELHEIICADCEREACVDVAEQEGWGCWFGIDGELYAFCANCSEREFG